MNVCLVMVFFQILYHIQYMGIAMELQYCEPQANVFEALKQLDTFQNKFCKHSFPKFKIKRPVFSFKPKSPQQFAICVAHWMFPSLDRLVAKYDQSW